MKKISLVILAVFLFMSSVIAVPKSTTMVSSKGSSYAAAKISANKNINNAENTKIKSYFMMNNLQFMDLLNKNGSYEIVRAGIEGSLDGYHSKKLGLTFVESNNYDIGEIECDNNFTFHGVKSGMTFTQIQNKLGRAKIENTWIEDPNNKVYMMTYKFDGFYFTVISSSKDGRYSTISFSMDAAYEKQKKKDIVSVNLKKWSNPVKNVLTGNGITVSKVELLYNKTCTLFYVSGIGKLNNNSFEQFDYTIKAAAKANGYKNFAIIDKESKLTVVVKCDSKRKVINSVIINSNSKLYHNYSVQCVNERNIEYKVMDYLSSKVPEISKYDKMLRKLSKGTVTSVMYVESVPDPSSSNPKEAKYYAVYVGENHSDHVVRWSGWSFYVRNDLKEIIVKDIVYEKYYTLAEWKEKVEAELK